MTVDLRVSFDTRQFQKALAGSPRILAKHLANGFRQAAFSVRKRWLQETPVDLRSGRFGIRRSFRYDQSGKSLDDLEGHFHTSSKAALGLEVGGRRAPKHGKYLAVPIGIALGKNGRVKRTYASPEQAEKNGKKFVALHFPGEPLRLYEIQKSLQNAAGARVGGAFSQVNVNGKRLLIPAYNLVAPFTQPAVLGLEKAFRAHEPRVTEILDQAVERAIDEAFPVGKALSSAGRIAAALGGF